MEFSDFDKKAAELHQEALLANYDIESLKENQVKMKQVLDELLEELNELATQKGLPNFQYDISETTVESLNEYIHQTFPNDGQKTDADKMYDLQNRDYLVAVLAGGLAVIVDAFLIKIPKDTIIIREGVKITQSGSPLTGLLRSIGVDENGNASQWVTALEKYFKVPYDKSVGPDIAGFYPKSHRLHSLAHDPSIMGLFWAIKDLVCGTMTCIDKNGCLYFEKVAEVDFGNLFTAPIIWLGHIVSDIFTKMGIPIPGWSYLQLLQFGSFGEKQRTIAEVARYMYLEGYDLRHLLSMSSVNAVIELINRLYFYLVCKKAPSQLTLAVEREYVEVKNNINLHNMLLVSYAVASCGNIAKICAYQGNPLAFNLPLWLGMIKEAVTRLNIETRSSKPFENALEGRNIIEENFRILINNMSMIDNNATKG